MPCSPLSKKRTRQNSHALLLNQLQRKLPVSADVITWTLSAICSLSGFGSCRSAASAPYWAKLHTPETSA